MARYPFPPIAVVISFIDCINRGDLDGLVELMTDDHTLTVLDEAPLVGRALNRDAWHGYFSSFPDYVIYPRYVTASAGTVAVLGTTTGSHLGLADEDEMKLKVIWLCEVLDGRVSLWRIAEDTAKRRAEIGIPPTA
jgi:ketosteroid isomerase-like protein